MVSKNTDGAERSTRGSNLSQEDRSRGGQRSAQLQQRDQRGQFAGKAGSTRARDGRADDRSAQAGRAAR